MKKGELLNQMLLLIVNGHADQYDKSGMPYVLHPLKVMHYLKTDDEELQCIALGHDYIEDVKGATYQGLREVGMTERIIDGIRCLTKIAGESYEEYQAKVMSNRDAMLVKLSDLRHNTDIRRLKGLRENDIERTLKYHKFYILIQQKLIEEEAANEST